MSSTPPPEDRPQLPSLRIGMVFKSLEEGADVVTDAIAEAHESFLVLNGTSSGNYPFWAAICRGRHKHKCPFKARVSLIGEPPVCSLRILVYHTCPAECHDGWKRPHSVKYLQRHNHDLVANNRKIPPKLVVDNERLKSGNKISYWQAHRTIKAVREEIKGDEATQFQFIKPFLLALKDEVDEEIGVDNFEQIAEDYDGAQVKFKRSSNHVFQAAAMLPTASRMA
jgi:hypothetical protein